MAALGHEPGVVREVHLAAECAAGLAAAVLADEPVAALGRHGRAAREAEERAASLEGEIAQLRDEIASLNAKLSPPD